MIHHCFISLYFPYSKKKPPISASPSGSVYVLFLGGPVQFRLSVPWFRAPEPLNSKAAYHQEPLSTAHIALETTKYFLGANLQGLHYLRGIPKRVNSFLQDYVVW